MKTNVKTLDDDPRIVVLEREPFWEPELKRQLCETPWIVRGCRSFDDLDTLVSTTGDCVAVLDAGRDIAGVLRWSTRRLVEQRRVPTLLIAGPEIVSFQWHAREAGVTAVVPHVITGHDLARLCRKQSPEDAQLMAHSLD